MRTFTPKFAKTIPGTAKQVFAGEIWSIYQWPQKLFDGTVATFEMARRPDTVKIIAIKDGKIAIVKQRQPGSDWYYDFPAGRNDHSAEDELSAAKRELREETGLSFKNWKLIEVKQPFSKIDWLVYCFLATDFESAVPQSLDGGEEIVVEYVSFDELKERIHQKQFHYISDTDFATYKTIQDLLSATPLYDYQSERLSES